MSETSSLPERRGHNVTKILYLLQLPKTASQERRYPIFVALERGLNASAEANIQPASDRVTNIGYLLSLGASSCLWQLLFHWQITISTSFAIAFSVLRNQRDIS